MDRKLKKTKDTHNRLPVMLMAVFLAVFGAACVPSATAESKNQSEGKTMKTVLVTANGKTFTAYFYDTPATRALIGKFPLSFVMSDLNRNEKYYTLDENLPSSQTERPPVIREGEIMCWNGNTLVLFYKTFSNSYGGYMRLGYVDNPQELERALGSAEAAVTFQLP